MSNPVAAPPTRVARFEAHSPEFAAVLGPHPRLERVVEIDAHEGPVYAADEDALYVTTEPVRRQDPLPGFFETSIKRIALAGEAFPRPAEAVTVLVDEANMANGMALDPAGRLIVCEQGSKARHARLSAVDRRTGEAATLVDEVRGLRLNSPNDVVVRSDGTLWFTDPSYGFLQGFKDAPLIGDFVYRFDPLTGRLTVVADGFDKPNGLAFSPDERVLYVGDSGANQQIDSYHVDRPHRIVAFDVLDGRRLGPSRLFALVMPGFPDGIKVDAAGRVYASAFSGVQVYDPGGELIGEVHLPGAVNFTFGGPAANVLFITTDTAVWAAVLATKGA